MIQRLISVAAGTTAVLTVIVPAPTQAAPAAAPRPLACNTQAAAAQLHTTASAVHLREGRGTRHRSRTVLPRNTNFYVECWGRQTDTWWAFGRVVSGPHNGMHGWVSGDHLATGYRH
ncbi:hypothetical protein [Streptomyces sp. NPDC002250]|uniref:hypothetical protein n=1 Tax=Streptomyces sp. NPDC002250 TaxID=3364641 RepID=UPI0036935C3E